MDNIPFILFTKFSASSYCILHKIICNNIAGKEILVELAKELGKFNDITMENKYKRTASFVNYLQKNFPPKRGFLPKFPETDDNDKRLEQTKAAVQKLTRLYHPDINGKHGEDWAAFCEEISKIANIVYGKIYKDMW